jgi:hypothetical protein
MSNTPFHYGAVPELETGLPLQQQVFQQRSSGLGARSKLVAALLCIVASVVFVSVAWTPSESGASSAALSPQPELLVRDFPKNMLVVSHTYGCFEHIDWCARVAR